MLNCFVHEYHLLLYQPNVAHHACVCVCTRVCICMVTCHLLCCIRDMKDVPLLKRLWLQTFNIWEDYVSFVQKNKKILHLCQLTGIEFKATFCFPAEKPSLQSRHSLDSSRVQEKEAGPLWITLALQKQKGFREQQQTREERRSQREAKLAEKQVRDCVCAEDFPFTQNLPIVLMLI